MIGGVLLGVSGRALAEFPSVVEWHRTEFFPRIASVLQALSRGLTFPIGEVAWTIVALLGLGSLVKFGSRAVAPLVFATGLILVCFYATWGLAYRYQPLSTKLAALPAATDEGASHATLRDLARRSGRLVAKASEAAPDWGDDDASVLKAISDALDPGFANLPPQFEAAPVKGIAFGPAKRSFISPVLSRLLVSGYFSPWSGEAQIDGEMPKSLWPRVTAHEKAHQRGFARENEATAIGVLVCLSSTDPRVFYGGTLGLFIGFDHELARVDPETRKEIWKALPKRVVDQLEAESAFWKRHQGTASKVSEKVNDTYLKAQGVRSGIESYAEATRLLLQAIETPTLAIGPLLRSVEDPARP